MHFTNVCIALALLSAIAEPTFAFKTEKLFEETVYNIRRMSFVSDDTGWAVGDVHWDQTKKKYVSTILKTTDAGGHWAEQNAGSDQSLLGVSFIDAQHGWACGENGTILATQDGGITWTLMNIATKQGLNGISFADVKHGWVVADTVIYLYPALDSMKGTVWYTDDGGKSWSRQPMPANTKFLYAIKCIDSITVWTVGCDSLQPIGGGTALAKAAVYHTTNGGKTWMLQFDTDTDVVFRNIDFANRHKGGIVGDYTICATNDSGATWHISEKVSPLLYDIQFSDSLHAYAVGYSFLGEKPCVYRTNDGGATWTYGVYSTCVDLEDNDLGLCAVSITHQRVIAAGDRGLQFYWNSPWTGYYYGKDTSYVQTFICNQYKFKSIYFADEKNGWAAADYEELGSNPSFLGTQIWHTNDGGDSWKIQYKDSGASVNCIWFADSSHGWAAGGNSKGNGNASYLLHTTDAGSNWQNISSTLLRSNFINSSLISIALIGKNDLWVNAGQTYLNSSDTYHTLLLHSTDGGANWEWIDTKSDIDAYGGICFVDSLHGWTCGESGGIIHTSDGGVTWVTQKMPDVYWGTEDMFSVCFTDSARGWLVGRNGFEDCDPYVLPPRSIYALHTTNGGATWVSRDLKLPPFNGFITEIQFMDSLNGWMCGKSGEIIHTVDGGQTWQSQQGNLATTADLGTINFVNDTLGWACGSNGVILRITGTNDMPGVRKNNPSSLVLHQAISFVESKGRISAVEIFLQQAQQVSITLYDLSGRKIISPVNGNIGAGLHRFPIKGNHSISGMFLISVKVGAYSETRKCIFGH